MDALLGFEGCAEKKTEKESEYFDVDEDFITAIKAESFQESIGTCARDVW